METEKKTLTIAGVKRIQGRADLLLSDGDRVSLPRAMLKERPYRSGMPFDRNAFEHFLKERSYSFGLEKAVSLLASRARTEKEILDALQRNAYPETAIARIMAWLQEAGYLDDGSFAEQWMAARTGKGIGTRRIRIELRQKGVSHEEIDRVMDSVDEKDMFSSAVYAAKKAARGKQLSSPADRQKVIAALARRGFDYAMAKAAIQHLLESE